MVDHLVFISHSGKDIWVARQISRECLRTGANTCLDEAQIGVGADFEEVIRDHHIPMNIFISYANADREWAYELHASLKSDGLESNFYDDLPAGEHWLLSLRRSIESAELIVSVLTEQSIHSPVFLFELGAAKAARGQLLPLLVAKNGKPFEVPPGIVGQKALRVESPRQAAEQIKQYIAEQMVGV